LECGHTRPEDNIPYLYKYPKTLEMVKDYIKSNNILYINNNHVEIAYIKFYYNIDQYKIKIIKNKNYKELLNIEKDDERLIYISQ
jgi:hypothetical protein